MATHNNCTVCNAKLGGVFGRHDVGNGICVPCDNARTEAERSPVVAAELAANAATREAVARILVTTEAAPVGLTVEQRLGIVSADVAFGMNILKDLVVGVRDLVGGRSETMQATIHSSRQVALEELKAQAHKVGANAVIGVAFTFTNIAMNGTSMVLVSATGTAATVAH